MQDHVATDAALSGLVFPQPIAPEPARRAAITLANPVEDAKVGLVYIGDHPRHSNLTSVQFLADDLVACGSFNGRRIDLVSVPEGGAPKLLHSHVGVYRGKPVQNDLLGATANGEFFATSNFHTGTSTIYTHDGEKISHLKDLPFSVGGFAHGVRFYDDRTLGLTACSGPNRGAHLFDIHTGAHILGVAIPRKCQDIVFVSPNRMLVLTVTGNPTFQPVPIYDAEIWTVDFDVKTRRAEIQGCKVFSQSHFDAGLVYDGKLYITDQYNNYVLVLTPNTLEIVAKLGGYDFPHGIDIRRDLIAITNYGTSSLTLKPLPPALLNDKARGEPGRSDAAVPAPT